MPSADMSLYDFSLHTPDGRELPLSDFAGRVLLIVNTASRCGFTPQYAGLERLYRTYRQQGFEVLGFPCNQFGSQEPGSSQDAEDYCRTRYDVSFPVSEKVDVNGDNAHPLYRYLTRRRPGLFGSGAIKWNFTKFLVDREGAVVRRYAPITTPQRIAADIERLLI